MGANQQWGTASGPWEFGPRVQREESGTIPPLFPLPHALATLLSFDPRAQGSRLDGARSGFRRLFSVDGSTAPSIPASSPATAQGPASLPPSSALGAPRLPQARAALAIGVASLTPIRLLFWTLHPQPAEPRPATPASDTRPPTNGPAAAAEEAAEGAPKPRDHSLCAQATRPSLPRPYRNRRELRDPSPLAVIRQIRKISPPISRLVNRRHLPGFPGPRQAGRGGSAVPAGRGGPSPRPLGWPAPPALEGPAPAIPGLPRLGARCDPGGPAFLPVKGTGASLQAGQMPPSCLPPHMLLESEVCLRPSGGTGNAAHAPQRAPRPGRKLPESSPQEHRFPSPGWAGAAET